MWHRDFPPDAREMWDIAAKALMLRMGGSVNISEHDLQDAANTIAEFEINKDGSLSFRVERN